MTFQMQGERLFSPSFELDVLDSDRFSLTLDFPFLASDFAY